MDFSLDLLKMGYVIAFRYERKKKFNLFSDGIFQRQLWQGFNSDEACYTHVAISSGDEYLVNVMPPTARLIKLYDVYRGAYIKILKYKGENFDDCMRYKICAIYNAKASNLGYDFWGVLHFLFPAIKQMKNRPFCSEACAEAFQVFYPDALGVKPEDCMPANFMSDEFEVTWEGYVPDNKKSIRQILRQGIVRAKTLFSMA